MAQKAPVNTEMAKKEPINVLVVDDGSSKWRVTYSTFKFPDLRDAKVTVDPDGSGSVVKFTSHKCEHISDPIPGKPEIQSEAYKGEDYVVKMKYTGKKLNTYFGS